MNDYEYAVANKYYREALKLRSPESKWYGLDVIEAFVAGMQFAAKEQEESVNKAMKALNEILPPSKGESL